MTRIQNFQEEDNKTMKTFFFSEIKKKQPTENIGTIGHVSHGKSTIVKEIAKKFTPRHSLEKERNITIDLGYANTRIYYSSKKDVFISSEETIQEDDFEFKNHISFVDCPGHNNFIATMCAGTRAFNAALIVISANDPIPQPQTLKHIEILKYTDITDIMIVLNKIDLLKTENEITEKINELRHFISQHPHLQNKPVVAVSAFKKKNIQDIIKFLSNIQNRSIIEKVNQDEYLEVLRTFDVNPLGQNINKMVGGVIGVSIKSGYVEIGNKVGVFPGYMKKNDGGVWEIMPIFSSIKSLRSENENLDIAFPGGLKALGLDCDPGLCKQNNFLGCNIFKLTKNNIQKFIDPSKYSSEIKISISRIHDDFLLKSDSQITIIINSKSIRTKIKEIIDNDTLQLKLEYPIYVDVDNRVKIPLLGFVNQSITVFGFGTIIDFIPNIIVKLPQNYEDYVNTLPDEYEKIKIIDDIPLQDNTIQNEFDMNHLKEKILSILEEINQTQIHVYFPELIIEYDPLKIIWINFIDYVHMIQNVMDRADFSSSDIRIYSLDKTIQSYIQYSFGLKNISDVVIFDEKIIVHIKTKRLKQKLDKVIKLFFKHYFLCTHCKKLSCLLVKVCLKPYKICIQCSERVKINDDWIKNITII